jgi:tetratricopeptide (TPR) repeat protein
MGEDMPAKIRAIPAAVMLVYLAVWVGKQYLAHRYYPAEVSSLWEGVGQGKQGDELIYLLKRAIELTPSNAEYYYRLSRLYMKKARKPGIWRDTGRRNSLIDQAIENARTAIGLNPVDSRYYMALAWAYSLEDPASFRQRSGDYFMKAISLNPTAVSVNYPAGYYYLRRWRQLSPPRRIQALDILKRVIELDEKRFDKIFADCWRIIRDYKLVQRIIPRSIGRHRDFARFLINQQMLREYAIEMAKVEYLQVERANRILEQNEETGDVLGPLKQAEGYYNYVRKNFPGWLAGDFKGDINLNYARLYVNLARSQLRKGDRKAAIASLAGALKKIPPERTGLIKEIRKLTAEIGEHRDGPGLQVLRASIEYKLGNYSVAIRMLEGLKVDSMDIYQRAAVFSLLERAYRAGGETAEADRVADYMDSAATRTIERGRWRGTAEGYAAKYVYQNGEMYWSGTISAPLILNRGPADLVIEAKASPANGIWPVMVVRLDGEIVGMAYVNNRQWKEFSFRLPVSYERRRELRVSFVNDGGDSQRREDRNLYVGDVIIHSAEWDRA